MSETAKNVITLSFMALTVIVVGGCVVGCLQGFADGKWYAWPCAVLLTVWFIGGGVVWVKLAEW